MKSIQRGNASVAAALLLGIVVCLGAGLTGCANTLNGAKQDANTDAQKTAAAASQAGQAIKDVPHDVDAAAAVTPEVKTAIIRDPVLNNPNNVINVDSHDHITHLTGHVMSAKMVDRATDDAQTVLTKRHPNYKVSNELTVAAGVQ